MPNSHGRALAADASNRALALKAAHEGVGGQVVGDVGPEAAPEVSMDVVGVAGVDLRERGRLVDRGGDDLRIAEAAPASAAPGRWVRCAHTCSFPIPSIGVHAELEQPPVRLAVGRHQQPAAAGRVDRLAAQVRDDAAGGSADRDAAGEVDVVLEAPVGDVRRAPPGRDPDQGQRRGQHPPAVPCAEVGVTEQCRPGRNRPGSGWTASRLTSTRADTADGDERGVDPAGPDARHRRRRPRRPRRRSGRPRRRR